MEGRWSLVAVNSASVGEHPEHWMVVSCPLLDDVSDYAVADRQASVGEYPEHWNTVSGLRPGGTVKILYNSSLEAERPLPNVLDEVHCSLHNSWLPVYASASRLISSGELLS